MPWNIEMLPSWSAAVITVANMNLRIVLSNQWHFAVFIFGKLIALGEQDPSTTQFPA